MSLGASIALSLHLGIAATNEIHPAVWYQHEGWKTGLYLNSRAEPSFFAGYRFGDKVWFETGFVTGYHVPVMARFGYDLSDRFSLWFVPGVSENGDAGVVFGIEFKQPQN